jgi:putative thioredoxin
LAPVLEKKTKNLNGKVKLVKINIDNEQEIAEQFNVQQVPTGFYFYIFIIIVFGVVGDRAVTTFQGAQSEEFVFIFF